MLLPAFTIKLSGLTRIFHKYWHILLLLALPAACITQLAIPERRIPALRNWIVYYSDALPAEAFLPYDLIIFDDLKHPPLAALKSAGRYILGYVSLGESAAHRPFGVHDAPGLKLASNPSWPGNFILDVRKREWHDFLLKEHIPSILAQGFDGIMIDTLDSPLYLAKTQPQQYPGLYKALVRLIADIRKAYPHIIIALNRGFDTHHHYSILPDIAQHLDLILAESTLTDHDFTHKTERFHTQQTRQRAVSILNQAKHINPALQIISLDYWDPQESCTIHQIYETQRKAGFIPLVSTITLDKILPQPTASSCTD